MINLRRGLCRGGTLALPNQMRQRITAVPSHQSTADFFNDICESRPFTLPKGHFEPKRSS
jgi:hypothetical protein